ncbi:AraC family transcriptional regulator [uncultured Paraglaciecola sp.]|uniref:AraC family transcriptional regulator n=1 Tax=uncultured Paraglaciecola sp. TaxID=1765024 RepID=UPI0030DDB598
MDVLSDVLDTIHIKGALYFEVEAGQPWVLVNPPMNVIGGFMLPDLEHVIPFHIMLDGGGWAKSANAVTAPLRLETGDVVMFPMGSSHVMTSNLDNWNGTPAEASFYQQTAAKKHPFTAVKIGEEGERSKLVCGYIGFNAKPLNPLLKTLPDILVVKAHMSDDGLMKQLLISTLDEMSKSSEGAKNIVTKLSELIFTQALRQHMENSHDEYNYNWLTAMRDEQIGKALILIHQAPFKKWTLALLAKECAMSRSSLAERFNQFVGQPPMQYINCWRMQIATKLLSDGMSIVQVAEQIGYSSDAAFQKAFKRYIGVAPGEWRAKQQH